MKKEREQRLPLNSINKLFEVEGDNIVTKIVTDPSFWTSMIKIKQYEEEDSHGNVKNRKLV